MAWRRSLPRQADMACGGYQLASQNLPYTPWPVEGFQQNFERIDVGSDEASLLYNYECTNLHDRVFFEIIGDHVQVVTWLGLSRYVQTFFQVLARNSVPTRNTNLRAALLHQIFLGDTKGFSQIPIALLNFICHIGQLFETFKMFILWSSKCDSVDLTYHFHSYSSLTT